MITLSNQIIFLFVLAIPVGCIAWTVTHEEIFAEPRNYCIKCSKESKSLIKRKFFYLFTCEYCFSHYISLFILVVTRYHLLFSDWRGYFIAGFSLVWVANIYMSLYNLLRVDLKKEKTIAEIKEKEKEITELSSGSV